MCRERSMGGGGLCGVEEGLERSALVPLGTVADGTRSLFYSHVPILPAEKPGPADRKGGLGMSSRDRTVGTPGQDNPGVSLHPLSADSLDSREPGKHF